MEDVGGLFFTPGMFVAFDLHLQGFGLGTGQVIRRKWREMRSEGPTENRHSDM